MKLNLKHTFIEELPADPITENSRRQVKEACFSFVTPKHTSNPKILHISEEMINTLGISSNDKNSREFINVFTGNEVYHNT